MVEIPEKNVTIQEVGEWYLLKAQIGTLRSKEALLRARIFRFFFKDPKEGTNDHVLGDEHGSVLKGGRVINRKVDEAALEALKPKLKEKKLNPDKLIRWKPEVNLKEYRALTEEERHLFDQCLIIKDGMPELDVVIPKKVT